MPICDACGQQNREQARFCGSCGQPLQAVIPVPVEEVKQPSEESLEHHAALDEETQKRIEEEERIHVVARAEAEAKPKEKENKDAVKGLVLIGLLCVFGFWVCSGPKNNTSEAKAAKAATKEIEVVVGDQPRSYTSLGLIKRYLEEIFNDPDSLKMDSCSDPALYFPNMSEDIRDALPPLTDQTLIIKGAYDIVYAQHFASPLPDSAGWFVWCDFRTKNAFGGMIKTSGTFLIANDKVIWSNQIE